MAGGTAPRQKKPFSYQAYFNACLDFSITFLNQMHTLWESPRTIMHSHRERATSTSYTVTYVVQSLCIVTLAL